MLTVATGVFTTVDLGDAIISQKYWVSINYVGVGRFAVAIGEDVSWGLKARKVKDIKAMYENIRKNTFRREDQRIYERIESGMSSEKWLILGFFIQIFLRQYRTEKSARYRQV